MINGHLTNDSSAVVRIEHDVDLTAYNTMGFAVKATDYVRIDDWTAFLNWWRASEQDLHVRPRFILGGGSNLVLTQDIAALVLHLQNKGVREVQRDVQHIWCEVQAGENWHDWVMHTVAQGWAGLENLALIPGTVGASPVQNIGAYGLEAGQAIAYVNVLDFATGQMQQISAQDCAFAYRDSIFKHALHAGQARYLIVSVCFKLRHDLSDWQATLGYGDVAQRVAERVQGAVVTPNDVAQAVIAIRQSKLPDPKVLGNAGSFFKNPVVSSQQADALKTQYEKLPCYPMADGGVKLAAGWLIEQAGWKGFCSDDGHIGVYEKQALVLVHHGGGSGAQLMQLAREIAADVQHKFGVSIEPEPIVV